MMTLPVWKMTGAWLVRQFISLDTYVVTRNHGVLNKKENDMNAANPESCFASFFATGRRNTTLARFGIMPFPKKVPIT
jgi:hypothetical protein